MRLLIARSRVQAPGSVKFFDGPGKIDAYPTHPYCTYKVIHQEYTMARHTTFYSNGETQTVCNKIQGQYDGNMAIYCDDGTYAGYRVYEEGVRIDNIVGGTHTYYDLEDGEEAMSVKPITRTYITSASILDIA